MHSVLTPSGRRAVASAIVLAAVACTSTSRAQDSKPAAAPSAEGATSEQLAEQAFKAYEANDFAGAVGLYMKSFQISGDARILYNVASIYDKKLHDRKLAEDFYRRYLKSTTTEPELVKKANDRLTEMKNEKDTLSDNVDAKAPVAAKPEQPAPPPQPEAQTSPLKPIGLVVAGVGVVGIGVGAVFGLSALSKSDDLKAQCPNDVCPNGDGPKLRDDASSAATLSTVFFAGGIALVAGGAAMYFLAPKSTKTTGVRVTPAFDAARAGVSFSGSF